MKGEVLQIDIEKIRMMNYFRLNNLSLRKLINSLFKTEVKRITYLGVNELKKMPDYKFKLLKFNIVLENYKNYTVLIKLIDKCKIEENLFCYWFFCEENYSVNTKFFAPEANILNGNSNGYEKRFEFQLLNRKNEVWKSSFVDIINLKQYCRNNLSFKDSEKLRKINKSLFIGIL